jgi:hypothetical protein
MKKFECRILQSHEMEVRGYAKDVGEFMLYVDEVVSNQPKAEIMLPQDSGGNQITNDPEIPPYVVTIEYLSTAHIDPKFVAVVDGTLEELTPNIKIPT